MEPYFRNNYNMIRNNFPVEDFGKKNKSKYNDNL